MHVCAVMRICKQNIIAHYLHTNHFRLNAFLMENDTVIDTRNIFTAKPLAV